VPHGRRRVRHARAGARLAAGRPLRAAGPGMRRFLVALAAATAALAVLPGVLDLSAYSHNLMTLAFLMIAGALARDWMGGFAGQVSFGHAALFGVGGFVAARLVVAHVPSPVAWIGGGLCAGAATLLLHPTLRLRGPYFSIATIGVGEAS